jgi:peptidoglycan/xylan/chitin deacetylase (PgdA/CDA1 family)
MGGREGSLGANGSAETKVALTFDDGPHPATVELLDLLDSYRVRATFFQCGMYVRARPAIALEVAKRGHELGNHTQTHPWLWRCSPTRIRAEIAGAQEAIAEVVQAAPKWFRAPYGVPGWGMLAAMREYNLTHEGWTVIGDDWKLRASEIAGRVLSRIRPGGVICLHDGRDVNPQPDIRETIEAVRRIVPELLARGYRFVTVTDLRCPKT